MADPILFSGSHKQIPRSLLAGLVLLLSLAVALGGCKPGGKPPLPVLAQVFAGPISLPLRQEITPGSKTVVSAKHGDKLDVIQVRRRFVRVRTPDGTEGWTDSRNLLTSEQMDALAELTKHAETLPSQGEATVFSVLNMHSDPSRSATSFYQIAEESRVDVVDQELVERVRGTPAPVKLKIEKPLRPKRPARSSSRIPPPPRGPAPALPAGWLDMSKTEMTEEEKKAEAAEKKNSPKTIMDYWTLVRTKNRKAGWVLSRNLRMAIPDEVAQYSEGARITSYFVLGDVQDEDQLKHHWLWTTMRDGDKPFDYDSFRVFIWNRRRHRYETSYIERRVEGYYPTEVKRGQTTSFALIMMGEDGKLYRNSFILEGIMVRKTGEELYAAETGKSN